MKIIKLYCLLLIFLSSNISLLHSENFLQEHSDATNALLFNSENKNDYPFAYPIGFKDNHLSSVPFEIPKTEHAAILYAPPSGGGDPLGIPVNDSLWGMVILTIIYGIYKTNRIKNNAEI